MVLKFHKFLFNCDISLSRDLPKAQSKQTVVKLEDSKREKKKSEGFSPRLGLIIIIIIIIIRVA